MSEDDILRVLACQIDIPPTRTPAERDAHLGAVAGRVAARLSETPADVVLLPELASIDYSRAAFDRLDRLGEALDGPSYRCWREIARAHGTYVVYGFPRRDEAGHHISAAVVDPDGARIAHYDKIHLAQYGASMEKEFFRPGDAYAVFDVGGFRLAPLICRDIRAPEAWRALAVRHGVDVLLHPTAFYRDASFPSWHAFAVVRALENHAYFLSVNRAGHGYGESILCPPWIDDAIRPVVLDRSGEDLRLVELSRRALNDARETYGFLRDRLPDYDLPIRGTPGRA